MQFNDPYESPKTSGPNARSVEVQIAAIPQIRWQYRLLAGATAILMLLPFLGANIWSIATDGFEKYVASKDLADLIMIPASFYAAYIMWNLAYKGTVPGQSSSRDRRSNR